MHAVGNDGENKRIILKILGSVALLWLAFGFSLTALVALGVAGIVTAVLSRFSRQAYMSILGSYYFGKRMLTCNPAGKLWETPKTMTAPTLPAPQPSTLRRTSWLQLGLKPISQGELSTQTPH